MKSFQLNMAGRGEPVRVGREYSCSTINRSLPVAILVGPFVGAVIGGLSLLRSRDEASRGGFGTVVGLALGLAGKHAIGITMIGLFLLKRFV